MSWIAALRLPVCIMGVVFSILGFKLAGIEQFWAVPVAIFFIGISTMLQNDWRDRFHDIRKGKFFAFQHERMFYRVLSVSWMITGTLVLHVFAEGVMMGIVLMTASFCGFLYSELRLVPLAPIVLVSLMSGIPILLPVAAGMGNMRIWTLFFATLLIVFGRELTKDIEDMGIDRGYKWTIPLALGGEIAMPLSVLITASGFLLAGIWFHVVAYILPVAAFGLLRYSKMEKTGKMRLSIDIAMALSMVVIFFFS